ncbi:MAG: methyltransferase domain-containing protein, partial [Bacteroidales bacterium]|nr:methyltransferase domain-containing protein [Bacteroidales bacterium]
MRSIIKFLVRKVPRPVLIKFSYLFSRIMSLFYKGDNVECPVCGSYFRKFLPYGNLGTDNRLCPKCLSLERHRLIWLFLKEKTNFFDARLKVLHIAPEQPFLKRFKSLKKLDYVTADLLSPIADVKMDVREMPFEDNSFDVVMCNHVLEHIDNEEKATSEIYRVLKKGGWAILQVPLDVSLAETYEDDSITDPKEREKIFGQYDHLRVYGRDYPQRLEKSGLKVIPDNLIQEIGPELTERFRLDKTELLYYCMKE